MFVSTQETILKVCPDSYETLYNTVPVHKSVGFCALWSAPSTTSSVGPVSWHVFRRRIDARYLMTGRPPPPTQLLKPVFLPPLKPLSRHVRAVITDVRVKPFQPSPPTLIIPWSWLILGFGINWRIFLYYECGNLYISLRTKYELN